MTKQDSPTTAVPDFTGDTSLLNNKTEPLKYEDILRKSIIDALAATIHGFNSSQLEAIWPLIESYGNSRELEGRLDEIDKTTDGILPQEWSNASPDSEEPMRVWTDGVVSYTNRRKSDLEDQKEKL